MKLFRILGTDIEKFLRRNGEKFADIEKVRHGRKRFSVFDGIDISRVLTDGETHVSCGNAFIHAKLDKAPGKVFLIHIRYHRPLSYCIE